MASPLSLLLSTSAPEASAFEPLLPGLILLLPLLGFAVNGALALVSGGRSAKLLRETALRNGPHDSHDVEATHGHDGHDGDHGVAQSGAHGDHHGDGDHASRPWTHRLPTLVGPGVLFAAFFLTAANFIRALSAGLQDPVVLTYWRWMPAGALELNAALQLDPLSLLMMMIITGVGSLIHVFSVGYMKEDPGYPRFFAYLNLFVFFMLVLVTGANFPVMFVGWEGVGLCSYLLIGFWFQDREKADAGKKAFIVNRVGDFGLLMAMFLLFATFGTLDYQAIFQAAPTTLVYGGGIATAITLFLLLGAAGKSAQIPLYVWLPDAMAGPTPVSALIHAATMVTAGVYLVARASVLFALAPVSAAAVATIGALTALFAATIALQQYDLKKVLAYSTVSQLGFMFMGVGVGAWAAGVFHLMTHAFFKALLFLGAGAVIHSMHHAFHATHSERDAQDMRNMGGMRRFMPVTWITMWIATLAIAGIWPFAGFFSKDEIIWVVGTAGAFGPLYAALWGIALVSAVLTAFYMTRMMVMTFHGANRTGDPERGHLHEAPLTMTIPLSILAVLSIFGGWINVPEKVAKSFFGGFGTLPMSEWLHHWLEPVTASADAIRLAQLGAPAYTSPIGGGHVLWGGISTVLALAVVLTTAKILSARKVELPEVQGEPTSGIRRILYHKWYVDELYDRVIVRPIYRISRVLWQVVDRVVLDGAVNLVGSATRGIGWFGSLFQTGQLNTYAFILAAGAVALLGLMLF
jgi:NADH-quinone oxidoreductase subunit L